MVHTSASGRVCVVLLLLFAHACSNDYHLPGSNPGGATKDAGVDAGPCSPTSCASFEYCSTCGASAGRCVPQTLDCIYQPGPVVCGCDGQLYITPCQAELERVGLADDARCVGPPGTFRCGTQYCTHGTQYCQAWYWNDVPGSVGQPYVAHYSCADLAAECGATPTCACVTSTECGDCTVSADGELSVMCLLPG
jgi:hypothetical protein